MSTGTHVLPTPGGPTRSKIGPLSRKTSLGGPSSSLPSGVTGGAMGFCNAFFSPLGIRCRSSPAVAGSILRLSPSELVAALSHATVVLAVLSDSSRKRRFLRLNWVRGDPSKRPRVFHSPIYGEVLYHPALDFLQSLVILLQPPFRLVQIQLLARLIYLLPR